MQSLFESLHKVVERQAELLDDAVSKGADTLLQEELFERYSVYLSLIQQQRHYYYGYAKPPPAVPPNSSDSVYHATGVADMRVVFELTRAEFPDLFAKMDAVVARERLSGRR